MENKHISFNWHLPNITCLVLVRKTTPFRLSNIQMHLNVLCDFKIICFWQCKIKLGKIDAFYWIFIRTSKRTFRVPILRDIGTCKWLNVLGKEIIYRKPLSLCACICCTEYHICLLVISKSFHLNVFGESYLTKFIYMYALRCLLILRPTTQIFTQQFANICNVKWIKN